MATRTIENYLKQLYLEQEAAAATGNVAMGRLAAIMGVVPGTATTMVKALSDSGLVSYEPRLGVRLTSAGEQLALHVLRRHRVVEQFLVQVVGLDWSEVHAEAEELEHVISEKVLDRMDTLLGHPAVDPHGDPIPTARGELRADCLSNLAEAPVGDTQQIARVLDQNADFLQFVGSSGLTPGSPVTVLSRSTQADSVKIRPSEKEPLTLSRSVAGKFLVRSLSEKNLEKWA